MPGIDYAALRVRITMEEVLQQIDFRPRSRIGTRVRGRCPFDCGDSPRDFVVNLAVRRYRCFGCDRCGNHLELWSSTQGQPFYQAALDLCQRLHIDPPWIQRG